MAIISSGVLGLAVGSIMKQVFGVPPEAMEYVGIPGKLLIQAMSMFVVPMIISAMASGVASAGGSDNKKLIGMTLGLFIGLSTFSTVYGMVWIWIIRPGTIGIDNANQTKEIKPFENKKVISTEDALMDILK